MDCRYEARNNQDRFPIKIMHRLHLPPVSERRTFGYSEPEQLTLCKSTLRSRAWCACHGYVAIRLSSDAIHSSQCIKMYDINRAVMSVAQFAKFSKSSSGSLPVKSSYWMIHSRFVSISGDCPQGKSLVLPLRKPYAASWCPIESIASAASLKD